MDESTPANEFWNLVGRYAESDDRADDTLREQLKSKISEALNLREDQSVYLAKATSAGYRNQLWQGQALTQSNDVIVFVDKTGNPLGLSEAAQKRLDPERKNGFDAIVICEPDGDDWKIHSVVEYENQQLSKRLAATFNDYKTVRVPETAGWQGPGGESKDSFTKESSPILKSLVVAKNLILEGPPGTGKTHVALEVAQELAGGDIQKYRMEEVLRGRSIEDIPFSEINEPPLIWEMVQFHPSYSYEDFVRGIRTDPRSENFELAPVDGMLPTISKIARRRAGKPTLLVLDELNRSNLSIVFGEALFALDPAQRGRPIRLQYSDDQKGIGDLIVPEDLLVLGTINTADKSISAIDFATRRRFRFLKLAPSEGALRDFYRGSVKKQQKACELMQSLNQLVRDKDLLVGHSYFMHAPDASYEDWVSSLSRKLTLELIPLLIEYSNEGVISERDEIQVLGMSLSFAGNMEKENTSQFNRFLTVGVSNE